MSYLTSHLIIRNSLFFYDQVQECYKVGVLYCKAGQVTEEEMYNNEHGCEHFERFLQLLGKKVELNGFTEFKGGLDVTSMLISMNYYFC